MKKKFFITLAMQAMMLTGYAMGGERPLESDTVITINNAELVTIEESDSVLGIEVRGGNGSSEFYYSHRKELGAVATVVAKERSGGWDFKIPFQGARDSHRSSSKYSICISGPSIGWVTALNAPDGMDVDMGASYEIMWENMLNFRYSLAGGAMQFSVGLGLNWKNFRMTGRTCFVKEDNSLLLGAYPEGADIQFSRIKVFSLMVPFMYHQRIYKNISFSAGPVLNFNTHASLKTRYKLDGKKFKETNNHIHHNRVTVDLMARLSFRAVGFYVKYSPCEVLNTDFGPKFTALSAGVTLFH